MLMQIGRASAGIDLTGFWLVLVLCAPLAASGEIPESPRNLVDSSLEFRLEAVSRELLGRPYRFSPLGEERAPDTDPLMRLDAFDCTTYVETVLALALVREPARQQEMLTRIRYEGGRIAFDSRRHLPVFQWLRGLRELGLLRDITKEIGGKDTRSVHAEISPAIWRSRSWRILKDLPETAVPSAEVDLPYLPLDTVALRLRGLQESALLSVVHERHEGIPLWISHQALLIPGPGDELRVRHARSDGEGVVVEENVERFLNRLRRAKYWPVLGVNVADILNPAID